MPSTRTLSGTLTLGADPSQPVAVDVDTFSLIERTRRAAMGLALCWSLAFASLFIPVVHFVAPPVLLLAGPIAFVVRFLTREALRQVRGVCPRCRAERVLPASGAPKPERNVFCEGCGNQLTLRL
ncbi:MAG: hypothetical protein INH41_07615 [Myxococcaceae bacterium]|jgi:hypothetical protein|nr:hypothetical protein [Myxococcaceae bacterium]MCA3012252.1 hypothetical protein [Myxococcaceae bacterium]